MPNMDVSVQPRHQSPSKLRMDGAEFDLSNLMSPTSEGYRRYHDDQTPSPSGNTSDDPKEQLLMEEKRRRRRVRFHDDVDHEDPSRQAEYYYPRQQEIPSCLDVDEIFSKLSASKMLNTGRPANPRLPSLPYGDVKDEFVGLSPRSTAPPQRRGGGDSNVMLSPSGRTTLFVDLDEAQSPAPNHRPYFGLDSPDPIPSTSRRSRGSSHDRYDRDLPVRTDRRNGYRYHRGEGDGYRRGEEDYYRREPLRGDSYRSDRGDRYDDSSSRRNQSRRNSRRFSSTRDPSYYSDREDFRRQNTRTYDDDEYYDSQDEEYYRRRRDEGRRGESYGDSRRGDSYGDSRRGDSYGGSRRRYDDDAYDNRSYDSYADEEEPTGYHPRRSPPRRCGRDTRTMVEVVPGEFVPLRGSGETWQAVQSGRVMNTTCSFCHMGLLCIENVDMVMCPGCRVISPVEEGLGGGGLGLGMSVTDARKELDRRR